MQLKKIKSYYDRLKKIDKHKNYLWERIYALRCEITDYVLVNHKMPDANKHWKALRFKANLIQKYSRRLREFDTIRWNEAVPESIDNR
jgi:hypothetical protein